MKYFKLTYKESVAQYIPPFMANEHINEQVIAKDGDVYYNISHYGIVTPRFQITNKDVIKMLAERCYWKRMTKKEVFLELL